MAKKTSQLPPPAAIKGVSTHHRASWLRPLSAQASNPPKKIRGTQAPIAPKRTTNCAAPLLSNPSSVSTVSAFSFDERNKVYKDDFGLIMLQ
jgi:hypothetical protein